MSTGNFRDTGSPRVDAQTDYSRARRKRALARLSARLRREPADFDLILPFEEVVAALGRRGERYIGLESIPLDSIVGSVGRERDFDRGFRPTSGRTRGRWERIATAARQGESFPPIDVYRIGEVHFVKDGHHRVSVARAQKLDTIDAYVTEVQTEVGADRKITLSDLPVKGHERLFFERVPLPKEARARIQLSDEWRYAGLAEGVEAWGYRAEQDRREQMTRAEIAAAWFNDEYVPVIEMLREADLLGGGTETEAYIRIATLRYLILRTHEWDDAVIEALRKEIERGTGDEDTLVHRLRREL
ncbi:MAG: hypothetical protein QOE06_1896 [Thermoleophilaceae bacterium]|nr:hypothetical protein [Thermoleophilaceae bacterium]